MTETQSTEDSALTFENILKLFKETDKRLDKQFKETEKRIKEIAEKSKETDERLDKRFKEIAEKSKETDERLDKRFKEIAEKSKETDAELDKRIKETDARFKEVAESFKEVAKESKETKRIVKETSRSVGALTDTWGEFVEGMVAPAAVRLFRERGFEVNRIQKRVNARKSGRDIEIDILVMNGDCIILIEAKSTLKKKNIDDHLKRLVDYRYFFPEHKEKKLLGAVAGIIIHSGIEEYAYKKGLFVLAQKGDDVEILNDVTFKASEW